MRKGISYLVRSNSVFTILTIYTATQLGRSLTVSTSFALTLSACTWCRSKLTHRWQTSLVGARSLMLRIVLSTDVANGRGILSGFLGLRSPVMSCRLWQKLFEIFQ